MGTPTTARSHARSAVPLPRGEAHLRVCFVYLSDRGRLLIRFARGCPTQSLPAGEETAAERS